MRKRSSDYHDYLNSISKERQIILAMDERQIELEHAEFIGWFDKKHHGLLAMIQNYISRLIIEAESERIGGCSKGAAVKTIAKTVRFFDEDKTVVVDSVLEDVRSGRRCIYTKTYRFEYRQDRAGWERLCAGYVGKIDLFTDGLPRCDEMSSFKDYRKKVSNGEL